MTTATPKRTVRISRAINEVLKTVTATVEQWNGDKWIPHPDYAQRTFSTETATAANRTYAELHGWSKRFEDVMAQDGGTAIEDKLAAFDKLAAHYASGSEEWNMGKAKRSPKSAEELFEELMGKLTPEQLQTYADRIAQVVTSRQG